MNTQTSSDTPVSLLEASLKFVDLLSQSNGRYVDANSGVLKTCIGVFALATKLDHENQTYDRNSVLFIPLHSYPFKENTEIELTLDISPFTDTNKITENQKVSYIPCIKSALVRETLSIRDYHHLMCEFNKKRHGPLRFIACFFQDDTDNKGVEDAKEIILTPDQYYI